MDCNQKGSIGEAKAIAYFLSAGYDVFVQFPGKSPFDLVVHRKGNLYRVSVKSTSVDKVNLRQHTRKGVKTFDNTSCDILAIYHSPSGRVLTYGTPELKNINSLKVV